MTATAPSSVVFSDSLMGSLIRSYDWSQHEFGPLASWPPELLSAVNLLLDCQLPAHLWWGPNHCSLYNDAYVNIVGRKHPSLLGAPGCEAYKDAWYGLGPKVNDTYVHGKITYHRDFRLDNERNSYLEECYFTSSYSPVRDANGTIRGVLDMCYEETAKVLAQRRLLSLREFGHEVLGCKTVSDAAKVSCDILATNLDTPVAIVFMLSEDKQQLRVQTCANIASGHPAVSHAINLGNNHRKSPVTASSWFADLLTDVIYQNRTVQLDDIAGKFGADFTVPISIRGQVFQEKIKTAVVQPIVLLDQLEPTGVLFLGTNPRLKLDESYLSHLDLVRGQVASALSMARNYEEECARSQSLAQLDKAKTAFFSNVSHEFRMPLTLISGPLTEMLTDEVTPLSAPHRKRAEMMQRNSWRLLKLVNSMLDYNRVEAGRMTTMFAPVDLSQVTTELAGVFRSIIEQAKLTYVVDVDPSFGEPVYIDRDKWEKIMFNLLSNAFKFTLHGSITVRLTRGTLPSNGNPAAILSITDTGCGVPEQEVPRLFERFHRVESSVGRSYEGSGIGLALTFELVKMHGGSINVDSQQDKGSTFSVYVPLGRSHLPRDRILSSASAASCSSAIDSDSVFGTDSSSAGTPELSAVSLPFVEEARRWLHVGIPEAAPANNAVSPSSDVASQAGVEEEVVEDEDFDNIAVVDPQLPQDDGVLAAAEGDIVIQWHSSRPVLRRAGFSSVDYEESKESTNGAVFHTTDDDDKTSIRTLSKEILARRSKFVVLIVDDNADMREYLVSMLGNRYHIVTALDGQDALDKLRWLYSSQEDPDAIGLPNVIVSDVMMPKVDGFELIKLLRANKRFRSIPVVILSARAGEEARVEGLRLGADDYLCKPFSSKEFVARVHVQAQIGLLRENLERMVQKRTKALVESEQQYRMLTQLSPVGVYRRDPHGRLIFANKRMIEILDLEGAPANEVVVFHKNTHPDDMHIAESSLRRSLAALNSSVELRYVSPKNGRIIYLYMQSIIDVDPITNEIRGIVAVLSDMSELKALQSQRYLALEKAEQESSKRAVDAEEHRRQQELFVDMVCHEIRNPLNGIVNSVDLIQANINERARLVQSMDNSPVRESLYSQISDDLSLIKSIDICMNHQRKITDDVLNLSKLSSGNVVLSNEPIHPVQLVTAVCDMFSSQARGNNISLTVDVPLPPHDQLCVSADPYRLSQVVINLVSNALKFTLSATERVVRVSVKCEPLSSDHCRFKVPVAADPSSPGQSQAVASTDNVLLYISVQDSGVGMTASEQASLFQRFRQANLKTYSRYGGTGLGLYISKMMLDLMGGEIRVESEPQKGSTFSLVVPCAVVAAASSSLAVETARERNVVSSTSAIFVRTFQATPPTSVVRAAYLPRGTVSTYTTAAESSGVPMASSPKKDVLRILIVEDNDINQRILKRQLESSVDFKCTTVLADNGLIATELYESDDGAGFDVILMDVEMPVMDGLEATRRIRAFEAQNKRKRVPIVGLSGNARELHVTAGIDAGMDGYLSKPYVKEDLMKSVLQATSASV